jgi:hypothetical protein
MAWGGTYHAGMDDTELPESLIALKVAVCMANETLAEHVRVNGPVRQWTAESRAKGAALQQACEMAAATLRQAVEESGLEREDGGRAVRRALMRAAILRMTVQPEAPAPADQD